MEPYVWITDRGTVSIKATQRGMEILSLKVKCPCIYSNDIIVTLCGEKLVHIGQLLLDFNRIYNNSTDEIEVIHKNYFCGRLIIPKGEELKITAGDGSEPIRIGYIARDVGQIMERSTLQFLGKLTPDDSKKLDMELVEIFSSKISSIKNEIQSVKELLQKEVKKRK